MYTALHLAGVIDRLEEDIAFGRRRPREPLVEDELVSQFGARKHAVRQALLELERMGLVERKRNRGAVRPRLVILWTRFETTT